MKKESKHSKTTKHKSRHSKTVQANRFKNVNSSKKKANTRKVNFKKLIVFILIIAIIILVIIKVNSNITTSSSEISNHVDKIIKESKKIEGLEHIKVEEVGIKKNENTSTITLKLKNSSNENQEPFTTDFLLLSKDNALTFRMHCHINEIQAKSEYDYTITTSNNDLLDSENYTIEKIE